MGVLPNQEVSITELNEAHIFGSVRRIFLVASRPSPKLLYWQCPLAPDVREICTMAYTRRIVHAKAVPLGTLNAPYCQTTHTSVQYGAQLHCLGV